MPSDPFRTVTKCGTGFSDAELAALAARLAGPVRPARVDTGQEPSVWFELGPRAGDPERRAAPVAELHRGLGRIKEDTGLALRFPRFTGRWRDDKAAEDATTTQELIDLYRTARRASAGT